MLTTGERIAQLRKERGLTQAKLAGHVGVSTSAIAMYETNRRQPDEAVLKQLATALDVTPTSLMLNDEEPNHSTEQNTKKVDNGWTTLILSREEARFILFMRMHTDCQTFLQDYMSADEQQRKQIEKAWRLIKVFQA